MEKERQRRWRQEQRAETAEREPKAESAQKPAAKVACHAPGEGSSRLILGDNFAKLLDELLDQSRAGLEREMRKVKRNIWEKLRHSSAPIG